MWLAGPKPIDPLTWLATACDIQIAGGHCVAEFTVTITSLQPGRAYKTYGPIKPDNWNGAIEACCWAFMAEFPEIGFPE